MIRGGFADSVNRRLPNPSCRIVDDAFDGLLVIGVHRQPEISYHILDFLALVERESSENAIWNVLFAECLLEGSALYVGAIENRYVVPRNMVIAVQVEEFLGDACRFFQIAVEAIDVNGVALHFLGIHFLINLSPIMLDDAVGSVHNVLR